MASTIFQGTFGAFLSIILTLLTLSSVMSINPTECFNYLLANAHDKMILRQLEVIRRFSNLKGMIVLPNHFLDMCDEEEIGASTSGNVSVITTTDDHNSRQDHVREQTKHRQTTNAARNMQLLEQFHLLQDSPANSRWTFLSPVLPVSRGTRKKYKLNYQARLREGDTTPHICLFVYVNVHIKLSGRISLRVTAGRSNVSRSERNIAIISTRAKESHWVHVRLPQWLLEGPSGGEIVLDVACRGCSKKVRLGRLPRGGSRRVNRRRKLRTTGSRTETFAPFLALKTVPAVRNRGRQHRFTVG